MPTGPELRAIPSLVVRVTAPCTFRSAASRILCCTRLATKASGAMSKVESLELHCCWAASQKFMPVAIAVTFCSGKRLGGADWPGYRGFDCAPNMLAGGEGAIQV